MKNKLRILAIGAYLAGRFDDKRAIVLSSSSRSGSTWLGSALCAIPGACLLTEPLNPEFVPEAAAAGISDTTYVEDDDAWPEGEALLRRIFQGRVINEWTAREIRVRNARAARELVVKIVGTNRLLPWIQRTFDLHCPIYLIRHPCAVIASQLKSETWRNASRPTPPPFIDAFPAFRTALESAATIEEILAVRWALDQIPVLLHKRPHPWRQVTYEELYLRPAETMSGLIDALQVSASVDEAVERFNRPSSAVYDSGISGIDGWQAQLSQRQVSSILNIVHKFGLHFYDDGTEPDHSLLQGDDLVSIISDAGMGDSA